MCIHFTLWTPGIISNLTNRVRSTWIQTLVSWFTTLLWCLTSLSAEMYITQKLMLTPDHFCEDYMRFLMQSSWHRMHLIGNFNIKLKFYLWCLGKAWKLRFKIIYSHNYVFIWQLFHLHFTADIIMYPIYNSVLKNKKRKESVSSIAKIIILNTNKQF